MSERVVEAAVVEERIVACPQCGRRNRLYKRTDAGVYKCGACRTALSNPFAAAKAAPSMRTIGIAAAAIIVLLVIIAIVGGNSSSPSPSASSEERARQKVWAERDARVDKLISEIGPAALPSISPPRYTSSRSVSVPAAIPTISIAPLSQTTLQTAAAPPAEAPSTVVPANNEILFDAYPNSNFRGELTIDNGTSSHALAKLIDRDTRQKILSFAISARNKATIYAIPDGSYDLLFAFGDQLYIGTDRFKDPHGFAKFADTMEFTTAVTDDSIVWSKNSVTLHRVISGNARTKSISREEFERY